MAHKIHEKNDISSYSGKKVPANPLRFLSDSLYDGGSFFRKDIARAVWLSRKTTRHCNNRRFGSAGRATDS